MKPPSESKAVFLCAKFKKYLWQKNQLRKAEKVAKAANSEKTNGNSKIISIVEQINLRDGTKQPRAVLEEIQKLPDEDLQDVFAISFCSDGSFRFHTTGKLKKSSAVYALEAIKLQLLKQDD